MTRIQSTRAGGFRSAFERSLATSLKRKGIKFTYEPYKVNYTISHTYTPDFLLHSGGILIEAKGYLTPQDRTKMIAVKEQNPNLDIRFVFANASNKLSKRSKTTYGDWADRNGFKWSDKTIPKEWIKK